MEDEKKTSSGSEDSKEEVVEINVGKHLDKVRGNPWIVSTVVLALVVVVMLVLGGDKGGGMTGNVVGEETISQNLIDFIEANTGESAEIISVEKGDYFYNAVVSLRGQQVPVYVTLDGENLVSGIVSLAERRPVPDDVPSKRIDVSVDDDAILGDENAPVTIIEFSDYQCPFCRKFWSETMPLLKEEYIDTGKVKFVYRDFPLDNLHPMATSSAIAAECAREQGGDEAYYEMHDKMFEEQNIIDSGSAEGPVTGTATYTEDDLKDWAQELGYDIGSCLDSKKFEEEVQQDLADGSAAGITGTPGFFVNGLGVKGAVSYDQFKALIDTELGTDETN